MPQDMEDARAAGFDAYLLKPVRWSDLVAAIRMAVTRHASA
jgi:CheY-like chemotaxis protein